jgi:uncharacterized caspase-like protein
MRGKLLAKIAVAFAMAVAIATPAMAERRVALVIGNAQYKAVGILKNPINDANAFAMTLQNLGFDRVIVRTDLRKEEFESTLRDFAREADKADWAVVYFSGHGIEVGGVKQQQ